MAGLLGPDTVLTAAVTQDRKAENNSGDTAFYSITDHAKGVKKADMALSPMLNSPTAFNQQAFPGALDPGTPVVVLKQIGEVGGIILGQSNTVRNGGDNQSGSGNLGSSEVISELTSTTRDINIAPDIQEV